MKQQLLLVIALALPGLAAAQSPRPSSPFAQSENQDQPIQIDAATLEVQDKNKMATFAGDVVVVQGDTTIKCQTLVVFYGPERSAGGRQTASGATGSANAPSPVVQGGKGASIMPQRSQDIRRIEARGSVTVISKDQNASGDLGVYDLKKKTITLTGNVVVSQGKNVLHGDRVVVDTVTGNAHFDSTGSSTQNRVRALILPGKDSNGGAAMPSMIPQKPN
jgi:lipopolysaccharide export system protein LptA